MTAIFDVDAFTTAAERERERFEVPGVGIAVVEGGEVVLATGLGLRNVDGNLPVTADTLFAIGSSTKAMTCAVLATLVDEGRIEWDEPLRTYLPGFRMHDPVATEQLALRDALSHRTGLPRHDFLWYDNLEITRAQIVERLQHLEPNRQFRQTWQYNNLMYLTAGHLIETLLECSWDDAVRQRIFEPLGMTGSCFSQVEMEKAADHSRGYAEVKDVLTEVPLPRDDSCGPAGIVKSSAKDMAAWVGVNASGGEWNGSRFLSESAIHAVHAPTMVMPEGSRMWPEQPFPVGYGLGWMVDSYRGNKLVHHGGNIDGFSAQVAFLPGTGNGVVVLTNRNATSLRDVLAWLAIDGLLGLEPLPWGERFKGLNDTIKASTKEAKEHKRAAARDLPPTHPLADYAGDYKHPGYGVFTIAVEGDELVPRFQNLALTMSHRHHDTWTGHHELFDADMPISFATDDEANIVSLSIPLEPSVAPITFMRQPDADLGSPERLAKLVGDYVLGPLVLRVEMDDENLTAGIVGQPRATLVPYRGFTFKVEKAPAQTIEFIVDAQGKVTEVMASGAVFPPAELPLDA